MTDETRTQNAANETGAAAPEQETASPEQETAAPEQETASPEQETAVPEPMAPAPERQSVARVLRRYFFTGLLVILPASISVFILWKLFFGLDAILGPLVTRYYGREVPGLGLVVLISLIVIIGSVASNFLGRRLIGAGERVVNRIPIIRWVYRTTKQMFSTILQERSTSFRRVVLVEYPHKGTWSMAFVTSETGGRLSDDLGRKVVTVFLPTTPNPTSGFFLIIPEEDVVALDMPIDEGLKLVVSAGVLSRDRSDGPHA